MEFKNEVDMQMEDGNLEDGNLEDCKIKLSRKINEFICEYCFFSPVKK
jgi:hypothetical protein